MNELLANWIVDRNSQKCADEPGGNNAEWRTSFWLRTSDDAGISRDWHRIINHKSGLWLIVKNAGTANSATLLQYTCNVGANTDWTWS